MTQKEYKNRIYEIECEIKALEKERIELRGEFLKAFAMFDVGDKIMITVDARPHPFDKTKVIQEEKTVGFIMKVHDDSFSGTVFYRFWKAKKDGTKSSHELYHYGYNKIELIEKASQP